MPNTDREVPQETMGFSPSELLYGRDVSVDSWLHISSGIWHRDGGRGFDWFTTLSTTICLQRSHQGEVVKRDQTTKDN